MSKIKELFTSMQQGLMDGVSIEKQMQEKFRDDEHRITLYKNKSNKKNKKK
tara:strand:- start:7935 stop:8087 length:153 start_codon:yes stop_codon:yes gene_type:complete